MGFLRDLFMSSDNVNKIVDAGISAGDKVWYTAEEKADDRNKLMQWYLNLLDSMKPFNLAMRLLAVGVFAVWLLHLLLSSLLYAFAPWACASVLQIAGSALSDTASQCMVISVAQSLELQMEKNINGHFSQIIMFYFGAAGLNSIVSTAVGKK